MQYKLAIGLGVAGAVLIILAGVLGFAVVPNIIEKKIKEEVRLTNGSDVMEKWKDIPYPIFLTFYVFHVTNPEQIQNEGATPILEERGPYYFRQNRTKEYLNHYDLGNLANTLQYRERKTYFFDQEKTGKLSLDDRVNIINIPFVSVIHGIRSRLSGIAPYIANTILSQEKLIRQDVKVGELLFDGFDVSSYTKSIIGGLLPKEFSGHRFGLYKGENGTDSLMYDIYTGVDDHTVFGQIRTYDRDRNLHFWQEGTRCDRVRGSDGSLFPPFLTEETEFDVFSSDLCRSLRFVHDSKQEVKGVSVLRYVVPAWELADPRINRDNQCYCLSKTLEECPKAGTMSLEGCRDGAPIMMSTPYFLDGDTGYLNESGLPNGPNRTEHQSYLDIEPNSGVLLLGHKRIQVNVDIKIGYGIREYKNLKKDIVFPLVWADESAEIDDETVNDLKSRLLTPKKAVDITKWVILGVGIAVFASGGILFFVQRR